MHSRRDVREWARAHGHEVGERGRIRREVFQAYAEAFRLDPRVFSVAERPFGGADQTLVASLNTLVAALFAAGLLRSDHEALVRSALMLAMALDLDASKAPLWKEFRPLEKELRDLFSSIQEPDPDAEPPSIDELGAEFDPGAPLADE